MKGDVNTYQQHLGNELDSNKKYSWITRRNRLAGRSGWKGKQDFIQWWR